MSRGAIARIEVGTLGISDKTAAGLAKVYGLSVEDLLAYVEGRATLDATVAKMPAASADSNEMDDVADTLNAAVTVNGYILDGLKRTGATLDQLDAVRAWVNAMGPISAIARLFKRSPAAARRVIDLLFEEAAFDDRDRASASITLLRLLLGHLAEAPHPDAIHSARE